MKQKGYWTVSGPRVVNAIVLILPNLVCCLFFSCFFGFSHLLSCIYHVYVQFAWSLSISSDSLRVTHIANRKEPSLSFWLALSQTAPWLQSLLQFRAGKHSLRAILYVLMGSDTFLHFEHAWRSNFWEGSFVWLKTNGANKATSFSLLYCNFHRSRYTLSPCTIFMLLKPSITIVFSR